MLRPPVVLSLGEGARVLMIEVVNMEADTTSAIGPARFLMPSIKLRRDIFDIGVLIEPGMCALHIEGDLDRD